MSDAASGAADFVYDNAGTISTVASAAAFFPPLTPFAGSIALATGAIQGYKDFRSGNYVGGVLNSAGVLGGAAGLLFRAESLAMKKTASQFWSHDYRQPMALLQAQMLMRRSQALSFGSYGLSSVLSPWVMPEDARGGLCAC